MERQPPSPAERRLASRPMSMYQFRRTSDSKRIHQVDTDHDADADAELKRQQNRPNFTKAKDAAQVSLTKGKSGFDWLWQKSGILGSWMNKQAGKMGMEAFWPTNFELECDKCARILYTFTKRQVLESRTTAADPYAERKTQKVVKKIPVDVIQKAEGLAIFTVFRSGLGWSAASGSGIVISRDSPTTWGPPSGILIHTIGVGFLAGIDVYDAVLVLRTRKAVMAFAKPKVSLGAELAIVAGPVGNGVSLETGLEASPVFAYTKSKGIYGGLQLDGNIVIERGDENARFYGRRIKAEQLLNGGAVAVPRAALGLIATIEGAEDKPIDPDELPENIDVAPSEQSQGVETVQESRERARAEADEGGAIDPVAPPTNFTTLTTNDWGARRRTLPPLPLRLPQAMASGSTEGATADIDKLTKRLSMPPVPPPRSSRRMAPVRSSIDEPRRSLEFSSKRLSVQSTTSAHKNSLADFHDKPPAPFKLHSASPSQTSIKVSVGPADGE